MSSARASSGCSRTSVRLPAPYRARSASGRAEGPAVRAPCDACASGRSMSHLPAVALRRPSSRFACCYLPRPVVRLGCSTSRPSFPLRALPIACRCCERLSLSETLFARVVHSPASLPAIRTCHAPLERLTSPRPPRAPLSCAQLDSPLERPILQLRAQCLLVELADTRLWDLGDEGELIRQPPLRDATT